MGQDLRTYFAGEKREGVAFMAIGAPALAAGAGLLAVNDDLARGAAYPLLSIGLIQLGAGIVVYTRTDRQVAGLLHTLAADPRRLREEELARMTRVNSNFRLLEAIETVLLLSGAAMAATGGVMGQRSVEGVGLGLLGQSAAMLVFDGLAARRATRYTEALTRFSP